MPDEDSARAYEELMEIFTRLYESPGSEFAALSRFWRPVSVSSGGRVRTGLAP